MLKYSILLVLFGVIAVYCQQKPGSCPISSGIGLCVELCSDDSQCPGTFKCCSNGCGHSCREPAVPTNGECPIDTTIGICIISPNNCLTDLNCKPGQKCCPKGCNRECVDV